jgi:hypothetical protein
VKIKKNFDKNREFMIRKKNKNMRVREWSVGDLVGVHVPKQDRRKSIRKNFPGIIVEKSNDLYRVR